MKTLTVPADVGRLDEVNRFVDAELEAADCAAETRLAVQLAVEEIFVNIASYAYPAAGVGKAPSVAEDGGRMSGKAGTAEVRCEVLQDPLRVTIQFLDSGIPYDPTAKEDADTSPEALMSRIGGLGILLVRRMMDDVRYTYQDGRNVLTIMKRF